MFDPLNMYMKDFMDLLTRLVLACEGINRSLGNANGSAPVGGVLGGEVRGSDRVKIDERTAAKAVAERRPSNVNDISMVSAEILERSRAASVTFAIDNMTVPWSEAHMRALIAYERKVDAEFGPGSSEQLPWRNLIPRGEDVGR